MKWTRRDRKSGARATALLVALALAGGTARAEVELLDVFASAPPLWQPHAPTIGPDGRLVVLSGLTGDVLRFETATGDFVGVLDVGSHQSVSDVVFGPDGELFVCDPRAGEIRRHDAATGALLGVFASGPELDPVWAIAFGPDGHLWALAEPSGAFEVRRYHGTTGAFLGVFASGPALQIAHSFTFEPGGDLLVGVYPTSASDPGEVLRYDDATGTLLGAFTSGVGLVAPSDLRFGPDGDLYVADGSAGVLRYDGGTGAFVETFVPGIDAGGLCYDGAGHLLVTDYRDHVVLRCDAASGAGLEVLARKDGLALPRGLAFGPNGDLFVGSPYTGVARFDGTTGSFVRTFTPRYVRDTVAFGPDGDLYTTDDYEVLRIDGRTGASKGVFATSYDFAPLIALAWGPDGHLYAAGESYGIERFDGQTGAYMDAFVPWIEVAEGPWHLTFGPDGDLYVAVGDVVRRFDGATGTPRGDVVFGPELDIASGLAFGPDCRLYVGSFRTGEVWRYDWPTPGAPILVAAGHELKRLRDLAFGDDGHLYVVSESCDDVLRFRGPATPGDAIARFSDHVDRAASSGAIPAYVGEALAAQLRRAQADLDRPGVAVRHLENIVLIVSMQVARGAVAPDVGAALIDGANEAMDTILRDRLCGRVTAGSTKQ